MDAGTEIYNQGQPRTQFRLTVECERRLTCDVRIKQGAAAQHKVNKPSSAWPQNAQLSGEEVGRGVEVLDELTAVLQFHFDELH